MRRQHAHTWLTAIGFVGLFWPAGTSTVYADGSVADVLAARAVGGGPGHLDARVELAAAHALVREFSAESAFSIADAALARALDEPTCFESANLARTLERYTAELNEVAVVSAACSKLRPARVRAVAHTAIVQPGTGRVALPAHTEVVVVDLRDLPPGPDSAAALAAAVAPALHEDVAQPERMQRMHDGPVDEVFFSDNVYTTGRALVSLPSLTGTGDRELPIVLLIGRRVTPEAASFAAALRWAGRAWIAGESVPLAVAESSWHGIGESGLAVRTSLLATRSLSDSQVQSDLSLQQGAEYAQAYDSPKDTWLSVSVNGPANADLDLYVVADSNADGVFDPASESVLTAATPASSEHLEGLLPPGHYQVIVQAYSVSTGDARFSLQLDQSTLAPLPDELLADLPGSFDSPAQLARLADELRGRTPPPLTAAVRRAIPSDAKPFGFMHGAGESRGVVRAGLLIAHGMLRLFYRYFDEVGDGIDERLLETLRAADAYDGGDRIAAWRILRRFGEVLDDGHVSVGPGQPLYQSNLPFFVEHNADRAAPIIRRSGVASLQPGDTIVALDGRAIEGLYAEELTRISAVTLAYKLVQADNYVFRQNSSLTLTLEGPSGMRRDETIEPQPRQSYDAVQAPGESGRASGPLTDLGAQELYYLNLDGFTTSTTEQAMQAIADASASAHGLILDMRGYPEADHYAVAQSLIQREFHSAQFEYATYRGPDTMSLNASQATLGPVSAPAFTGPIVLLTGPHAVSRAENFMQMLVGAGRLTKVVGRHSAGTNGNITGVPLPGGFTFRYTGMKVRNPDGSRFVGIAPDEEVPISASDLSAGRDLCLERAIGALQP